MIDKLKLKRTWLGPFAAALAIAWIVCLTGAIGAVELPPGFVAEPIVEGITGATGLAIAPDGRIFVCEQTGTLRVVKEGRFLPEPFLTLEVDSYWERGLIGVALDPNFPGRPFIYVNYIRSQPYPHHRISRFTARGDVALAGSEVILVEGDNQDELGGKVKAGHQGGGLHFGADGKLYIGLGEQTAETPSQRLDTFQGKILRVNPDGSIPSDNPFFAQAAGKYRAIWALGLRNPFAFAFQPGTGRMFINDVGGSAWEEINEGVAGANYGWPQVEGYSDRPEFRNPLHAYRPLVGRSIAGGTFYHPAQPQFPPEYVGRYFFLDYMNHWMRVLDPNQPHQLSTFARNLAGPVAVEVASDGSLWVLNRNAWVKDNKWQPGTGSLWRIRYLGVTNAPAPVTITVPVQTRPAQSDAAIALAPSGGTFTGPVEVRVLGSVVRQPGVTVHYTTDGSLPTRRSSVYGMSIKLRETALVVAKAFSGDDAAERVVRARFEIRGTRPYGLAGREAMPSLSLPPATPAPPRLLSQTGLFHSLADLQPDPALVAYAVNCPIWLWGVRVRRWMGLPNDERIVFSENGEWIFPAGTVSLRHYDLPATAPGAPPRPLETQVIILGSANCHRGLSYKWRADGSDAELVDDSMVEKVAVRAANGTKELNWYYPGHDDCLSFQGAYLGFVREINTRQLNRAFRYEATGVTDNQLRTWNYLGLFWPPLQEDLLAQYPRLASLEDPTASLEHRVHSYLDANCAMCHFPGGPSRGGFDARFDTPWGQANLILAEPLAGDLGLPGAKLVRPGDPQRSILYLRLKRFDIYRMPPAGLNDLESPIVPLLEEWIRRLAPPPED